MSASQRNMRTSALSLLLLLFGCTVFIIRIEVCWSYNYNYIIPRPWVSCDEVYRPDYCGFPNVSLDRMRSVEDFENCGPGVLPKIARNYYYGTVARGLSYRWNLDSYRRIAIVPRRLTDTSNAYLWTVVLNGQNISIPIGLSPAASQMLANPLGEAGTAIGVAKAGAVMILSSIANKALEEVADAARSVADGDTPYALWMQTYPYKNHNETMSIVRRAERAGYKAIVVSLAWFLGSSNCDSKGVLMGKKFPNLFDYEWANEKVSRNFTFKDLKQLTKSTRLPIVVKGIMRVDEAVKCAKLGVRGILVSNHGGRQVDGFEAPIFVLRKIAIALKAYPNVDVYVDGGVRSGVDVFKAIAAGAKMVFVGRPQLWSLAIGGPAGVEKMIGILKDEFNETMLLSGYSNPESIRFSQLRKQVLPAPLSVIGDPYELVPSGTFESD